MPLTTYSKGLILWIDDNLDKNKFDQNIWFDLFGNNSDRVFRLMDLSLDIATNYLEALEKIKEFNSYRQAGIFLYCILENSLAHFEEQNLPLPYSPSCSLLHNSQIISYL